MARINSGHQHLHNEAVDEEAEEEKKGEDQERRVPIGDLADRIDEHCRRHCGIGAVIESVSEVDSWPQKSVQGTASESMD